MNLFLQKRQINYMMVKHSCFFIFILLSLFLFSCKREGCTDPIALNYDSKANYKVYSCKYLLALALVYPKKGQYLTDNLIIFIWRSVEKADSYLIEIICDSSFANIIDSETVSDTSFSFSDNLKVGSWYFWRADSI